MVAGYFDTLQLGSAQAPAGGSEGAIAHYYSWMAHDMSFYVEKNDATAAHRKWVVFVFNKTTGNAVTGDAANITANIRKDGSTAATNDVNPTELEDGYYEFDLTQAETNFDQLMLFPATTTGSTQVIALPPVLRTYPVNFEAIGIESDGDVHADVKQHLGVAVPAFVGGRFDVDVGAITGTDVIGAAQIAANAIGASELATDAIGDAQIATGAIASTAFAAGAINAAAIGTGAIDADAIATDAITSAKIAANAIGASELAADAIGDSQIATGAIAATAFATGAINDAAIATDAITAAKIAANAIGASELATDAIGDAQIATGAIAASAFAADAISAAAFSQAAADKVITQVSGTADSGSTTTLVDDALTEADTDYWVGSLLLMTSGNIAGQVRRIVGFNFTTNTITVDTAFTQAVLGQDYAVLRTQYAEAPAAGSFWSAGEQENIRSALGVDGTKTAASGGQVQDIKTTTDQFVFTTANRVDSQVFGMQADTITASAIQANAIGASELATDAIGDAQIATGAIASTAFAAGAINAASIATDAITVAKIAANAIGASELAADAVTEIRDAVTGGAYALDTDANGRVRIVDGTSAGELDTTSGLVNLNLEQALDVTPTIDTIGDSVFAAARGLPTAAPGAVGGLPTVDGNNRIAGIQGAINDFDGLNDLDSSTVSTLVGAQLVLLNLDHLFKVAILDGDVIDNSWAARITDSGVTASYANFDNTTDSLRGIRDNTAWDTATGFSTHSAADVWTSGTRTLTAIGTGVIDATARNEIADSLLSRNVSNVEATAGEHTFCTIVLATLEWDASVSNVLTIKRTDGSTTHVTKTTASAAGNPITSVS